MSRNIGKSASVSSSQSDPVVDFLMSQFMRLTANTTVTPEAYLVFLKAAQHRLREAVRENGLRHGGFFDTKEVLLGHVYCEDESLCGGSQSPPPKDLGTSHS